MEQIYSFAVILIFLVHLAKSTDLVQKLLHRSESDPEKLAAELISSEFAAIFNRSVVGHRSTGYRDEGKSVYPLVFLHGMGDSCFNRGDIDLHHLQCTIFLQSMITYRYAKSRRGKWSLYGRLFCVYSYR